MPTILYNHRAVYYESIGEGLPIVLLHGFCEDSSIWYNFIEKCRKSYQYIIIDFPGFGNSEVQENCTVEMYAEIVNQVLVTLKISKCLMIGHSMGGYVTLAFGELFPKKVVGIGLFHSHPFEDDLEKKENRRKTIRFIERQGVLPFVKQMIPSLFYEPTKHENIISGLIKKAQYYPTQGVAEALKAMIRRPDRTEFLKKTDIPVLFLIGEEDITIPFSSGLKMAHFPMIALVHFLPKVGHMGMFEVPDKSRQLVLDFITFVRHFSLLQQATSSQNR